MRRRSFTGPLLLLIIGGLFLWHNLHPEAPIFDLVARYWPFVLIGWGFLRLVEVMIWSRDNGRRSSFSGGEVVLIILICIAGTGIWQAHEHGIHFNAGGLDWLGEQYDFPVSAQAPAAGIKRIVFENARGNIKLIGADSQQVSVSGHKVIRAYAKRDADDTNGKTPVEIVPQGDRLLIRTNHDRVPDNQRMSDDIEVTAPRGISVEARGRIGDLEVTDITGDVDAAGDRGDVRLTRIGGSARLDISRSDLIRAIDVKGRIDLQGNGTDVEMENIEGQVTINGGYRGTLDFKNLAKPLAYEGPRNTELHVQAVPGRINMDLGEFTGRDLVGPVRLMLRSRDVKLEQFTQSLELETERGDIELHPGKLPLPSIDARSGIGRIDLALPDKAAFQIEATAERGEAVNDFGGSIEKDSQGRTSVLKGKVGEGPMIKLTASRGSIAVRKEGTLPPAVSDEPGAPKKPKANSSEIRM
ncbi:MAG TPA: DUF4097 family beta strand repeat-containing protein [Bryobacteraceae bacterium]